MASAASVSAERRRFSRSGSNAPRYARTLAEQCASRRSAFPFFVRMILVRKPDATFRGSCVRQAVLNFLLRRGGCRQNSDAETQRGNEFLRRHSGARMRTQKRIVPVGPEFFCAVCGYGFRLSLTLGRNDRRGESWLPRSPLPRTLGKGETSAPRERICTFVIPGREREPEIHSPGGSRILLRDLWLWIPALADARPE